MTTFGIAGVQMHVTAYQDNVDRMHGYMRHIRARFPWVRMVHVLRAGAARPAPRGRADARPHRGATACNWQRKQGCG